ncbi:MAG: ADP-ribosylation factor-like protein [Candidatus Helarchaeota archaeon]
MESFKILFVGLANAGKTSIILTLRRQFSDLSEIKPTKGIERSEIDILGFKILTWDLGGQDIYRTEYKKKEAIIFSETEILYYVVDIQDPDSYEETLQYFQEIVEIYKMADPDRLPYFVICLNKLDPNLIVDYSKEIDDLTAKFSKIIKNTEYKIFKTSIYNLQALIEAFSWGISKFLPKQSELELILKQFLHDFPTVNAVNILEKHSMFLIHAFRDEDSRAFFRLLKDGIISIIENLGTQINLLTFNINQIIQLYVEKLTILQRDYFFLFMGKELDFEAIQKALVSKYYGKVQDVVVKDLSLST